MVLLFAVSDRQHYVFLGEQGVSHCVCAPGWGWLRVGGRDEEGRGGEGRGGQGAEGRREGRKGVNVNTSPFLWPRRVGIELGV